MRGKVTTLNAECGMRNAEWETGGPMPAALGVRDPGAMNRGATASGALSVGEISPALVREWGPLLKPTGLGLLLALHSFEETAAGHPFFGWAHCTQTALAAYLDTSQDTIARYSQLLLICGLVQVEEVEIPRGKQKLYRVARGLPLPSVGLLEYLVFDADGWTRKHTGWLTAPLAPLGAATELTRLTEILGRAYRVTRDRAGVATLVDGARLTAAGSYRGRRPAARQSAFECEMRIADCGLGDGPHPPALFPTKEGGGLDRNSALGGGVGTARGPHAGNPPAGEGDIGLPAIWRGQAGPPRTETESVSGGGVEDATQFAPADGWSASGGVPIPIMRSDAASDAVVLQESAGSGVGRAVVAGGGETRRQESAGGGLAGAGSPQEAESREAVGAGSPQGAESGRSAGSGVGVGVVTVGEVDLGRESAGSGAVGRRESAGGGVGGTFVNVDRESVRTKVVTNVNGADGGADAAAPLSAAELGALLDWGTAALDDGGSREWHRQCVADYGADLYEWAIQATVGAVGKGRVGRPGAYFTSLLRRRGRPGGSTDSSTKGHEGSRRVDDSSAKEREGLQETDESAKEREGTQRDEGWSAKGREGLQEMDESAKEREEARRDLVGLDGTVGVGGSAAEMPTAGAGRVWQAALIHLRVGVPAEVYGRVLRYAVLLRLDLVAGTAVLGVPAAYMRDAIQGELAAAVGAALGLVCGGAVRVTAVVR